MVHLIRPDFQALDSYSTYSSARTELDQIPSSFMDRISAVLHRFFKCLSPIFGVSESRIQSIKREVEENLHNALNSFTADTSSSKIGLVIRVGEKTCKFSYLPNPVSEDAVTKKVADFFESELGNNPFTRTYSFTAFSFKIDSTLNASFRMFKGKSWGIFYSTGSYSSKSYQFSTADLQLPNKMNENFQLMYGEEQKFLLN